MSLVDLVMRFAPRHVLAPREGYALWADTYPRWAQNPLMQAEQAVVEPALRAALPTRALDVGTGTGRCLPLLASAGARVIVGIDLSMAMLRQNASSAARVCGDACRLPFRSASFDLVCASLMAGDVEDLGAWLREAARVLSPGGHLVYSDFHASAHTSGAGDRLQRTFRAGDGRLFELSYCPHEIEDHLSCLKDARLVVKTIREPRLPGRSTPVVVVFHAVKPGRAAGRRAREGP